MPMVTGRKGLRIMSNYPAHCMCFLITRLAACSVSHTVAPTIKKWNEKVVVLA